MKNIITTMTCIGLLVGCSPAPQTSSGESTQTQEAVNQAKTSSLKDAYANRFLIGTALSKDQILGNEAGTLDLIAKQFNAVTAENEMKWEKIEPTEGQFYFDVSDQLVKFSKQHDIFVVGHTLLWHQQTPDWVFVDANGEPASKELLLSRLKLHIDTVVGRYKGVIPAWDVVNEALNEDGSWRQSKWFQILGEDLIVKAFEYAQQADPNAQLYYNDYNLFKPEKRQGVLRILELLQQHNLRIDAVGIQGHYGIGYPDLSQLDDSIAAFKQTGVKVMITELDISVLPFPSSESQGADISIDLALQKELDPYSEGLPENIQQQLSDSYVAVFKVLLKHSEAIDRVTFWGVSDKQTWRNDWPMKGRTDYPLLFDRQNQAKPVVSALIELVN